MPNVIETADASGNTSTAYTLQVGQTAQGTLGAIGDHDWYGVNLVAGQTYTFALTGTGTNDLNNPLLSLYGPGGGAIVASNDDGLPNNNSIITYTATSSGTYYIDVGAFNNAGTGQYGVSVAAGTRATVDVEMGAGIMDAYQASGNFEFSWSATPGTGATVSVGFRLTNDGVTGFSPFTAQQMAATLAILPYFSDVCGLTFDIVNPGGYTDNATILLSNLNDSSNPAGGYASYPFSTDPASSSGDVHINAFRISTTDVGVGSNAFRLLMHELGHSMGLSHPGLYDIFMGGTITYANNAQFIQDTQQYTVMSYFDESNLITSWGTNPDTLMLFDIYALQQIYGANFSTRSGNTVYGFNSTAGGVYNFVTNLIPALCIWDGGGIDTLDLSGYSISQDISLIAGTFSDVGGFFNNVSIAFGAVIENAVGGSNADVIHLSSANVNNLVNGNGGSDTVWVTYNFGSGYTIQAGSTASNLIMLGAAGTDTLLNAEFVHFADGTTVSTASLITQPPAALAPNDLNGDGNSDSLMRNLNSGALVVASVENGTETYQQIGGIGPEWQFWGANYYVGNSAADFLVRNSNTGALVVGEIVNGSAVYQQVGGAGAEWQFWSSGNFIGGGASNDFLMRNANGALVVGEVANGSVAYTLVGGLGSEWSLWSSGDFLGDARDDFLIRNSITGALVVGAVVNGSVAYTPIGGLGSEWQSWGSGDFLGDARDDFLMRNANTGALVVGQWNGANLTFTQIGGLGSEWLLEGTGDYVGNTRSDFLMRNLTDGSLVVGEMVNGQVTYDPVGGVGPEWLLVV